VEPLPWNLDSIVVSRAREAPDLLDLGTGGGEWLAGLEYRPARTVATESWAPNVPVARRRLEPIGIQVVRAEAARDNVDQEAGESSGRLPFPDDSFHLVVSRHEAYVAAEVARVLVRAGRFVTQQVSAEDEFARLLGLPQPEIGGFPLELARRQLQEAGFDVVESGEGRQLISFADVGALTWYLKAVPWALPSFQPQEVRDALRLLHDSGARLETVLYGFWLEAVYR
jgi:SAM-dependent methyltransferase